MWLESDRCKMDRAHGEIQVEAVEEVEDVQEVEAEAFTSTSSTSSTTYAVLIHSAIQSPTSRVL